jgi:hypothetical protein
MQDTPLARFSALVAEASAIGAELDSEHLPAALGSLEVVRVELWTRLSVPATSDRLLTAEQAAERLGIGLQALYRGGDLEVHPVEDGPVTIKPAENPALPRARAPLTPAAVQL